MQGLYTWFQSEDRSTNRSVESIFHGAERAYDLYLSLLQLPVELASEEDRYYSDLQPVYSKKSIEIKSRFASNLVITGLNGHVSFNELYKKRKLSWQNHHDLVKKLFFNLRQSEEYKTYIQSESHTQEEDIEFVKWVYKQIIMTSEVFQTTIDEQNIWWADAVEFINSMVLKTIKTLKDDLTEPLHLMPLYRDTEDDREFMEKLFRETVNNDAFFESLIDAKTKNWELDRIALVDVILMKMALAEIITFPGIPVKVSINEYIDISKEYSTPKSKVFINGVLDKIVTDLKSEGKIRKTGRGLIE